MRRYVPMGGIMHCPMCGRESNTSLSDGGASRPFCSYECKKAWENLSDNLKEPSRPGKSDSQRIGEGLVMLGRGYKSFNNFYKQIIGNNSASFITFILWSGLITYFILGFLSTFSNKLSNEIRVILSLSFFIVAFLSTIKSENKICKFCNRLLAGYYLFLSGIFGFIFLYSSNLIFLPFVALFLFLSYRKSVNYHLFEKIFPKQFNSSKKVKKIVVLISLVVILSFSLLFLVVSEANSKVIASGSTLNAPIGTFSNKYLEFNYYLNQGITINQFDYAGGYQSHDGISTGLLKEGVMSMYISCFDSNITPEELEKSIDDSISRLGLFSRKIEYSTSNFTYSKGYVKPSPIEYMARLRFLKDNRLCKIDVGVTSLELNNPLVKIVLDSLKAKELSPENKNLNESI